ncbi:hypothetical protein ABEG10_25230 [Burkholderia cenocepacia]|uniref:hypothetical protein n=1 Tax=Burkholderia cenocepacia TaxID=95486 RepID=UPI0020A0EB84|nr:hypothetical protein [Burkholderia cenocepacia]MCO8321483.1 hypothetical protein [Burkholderia cenocepacia]MCO8328767.1 hypothetical protein [Burkholderia cenocepacia]MCO8336053.1 hypothetical protein [Burkholderia cenocepacia]MCO8343338.1 hypothetical protein [Burkholderia cenocepacia]MCO8356620.1 hypothetical protein [Burkholderia cenocepacia]
MYIERRNLETVFTDDPCQAIPGSYPRIVVNDSDPKLIVAALLDHGWRGVICDPQPDAENQEPMMVFNSKLMMTAARRVFNIDWFTTRIMNEFIRQMGGEVLRSNSVYHYGFRRDQYHRLRGEVMARGVITAYWPSMANVERIRKELAA